MTKGVLQITGPVRFANPISGGSSGGKIFKQGGGTLTLAAIHAYDGDIEIRGGTLELEPGASVAPGSVVLDGGTFSVSKGNTVGSLSWENIGFLRLPIGATAGTPLAITGELASTFDTLPRIDLVDQGAVPGSTYTLATFGSTSLTASQFLVTGIPGKLAVEPHALKFTVAPEPAVLGVGVSVTKHKNRAVYAVRNTGDVPTIFRLQAATRITNASGGTRFPGRRVALTITYHRNGANITSAIKARNATVALAPGSTARITAQIHVRGGAKPPVAQRFVTSKLTARAKGDATIFDSAGTRLLVMPTRN